MDECSPFAAVFGCFLPCVALVEKGEVVLMLFTEGVEVATLRAVSAESGEQSLTRKTAYVHTVEVAHTHTHTHTHTTHTLPTHSTHPHPLPTFFANAVNAPNAQIQRSKVA